MLGVADCSNGTILREPRVHSRAVFIHRRATHTRTCILEARLSLRQKWLIYLQAFTTSAATSSMSRALSFVNGLGMSRSESATSPLTETSKQPLRGFSSLILTCTPGMPAFTRASSFVALVLNAPQDLQASILTTVSFEVGAFFVAFALVSLAAEASALRFGAMCDIDLRSLWRRESSRNK